MDYNQVLDYLFSQLPMFQRIGPAAYKADLGNTIKLMEHLGNPHKKFRNIHIAGTNGKGSVSHLLASIFQEAGYKTGLCTSPHLKDFRERFRVNGKMIEKQFVAAFVEKHKEFLDELRPSFFEMTIAMTFDYFAHENVDMAIIETGLGGRLDSTNVVTPLLSVITNIGYDHMNLLGNTLEAIAGEKAGIIKPYVPVVIGRKQPLLVRVFTERASSLNSEIVFAEDIFRVSNTSISNTPVEQLLSLDLLNKLHGTVTTVLSPLTGTYQVENITTVLAVCNTINLMGEIIIPNDRIVNGIRKVIKNTGIMGRWQLLRKNPITICDTGHNEDGIKVVLENIDKTPHNHLHFVIGMVNDKDLDGILKLLPTENTTYYFCKPDVPRGLDARILAETANKFGLKGWVYKSVNDAYTNALQMAGNNDMVFVGGSTFVVAEVV